MVITSRTYTTLFASSTGSDSPSSSSGLVRLPLSVVPHYETRCPVSGVVMPAADKPLFRTNLWSSDEHDRFLRGLEMFPNGPWKEVAKIVGTKTTRQTMTHAQKYRQKIERRMQTKSEGKKPRQCKSQRSPRPRKTVNVQSSAVSFIDELLSCDPMDIQTPTVLMSSPTQVDDDVAFDASCIDHELKAVLALFSDQVPDFECESHTMQSYTVIV